LSTPHAAAHDGVGAPRNSSAAKAFETLTLAQPIEAVKKNYPLY